MEKLDKYLIGIDGENSEDLGMNLISFVKSPAIMVKGMAFNNQKKINFNSDEKKMRIVAPALIPMDIYRYDQTDGYEYEVRFTTEVIEKLRDKFMSNLKNRDIFNLEHSEQMVPAFILETWIVGKDPKQDKSYSEFGIEVPTGTMMVMSQITDRDYYDSLVKNEQFAYSIEGFFNLEELKLMINKKEEEKMKDNLVGEFKLDGNLYTFADGKLVSVTKLAEEKPEEEVAMEEIKEEEVKAEEVVEEVKEEVKEEEIVAEEKEEVKMEIDEAELMIILQPKLDEIYKMIADLTAKIEDEEVAEEVAPEEVQMSIAEKFSQVQNFLKRK